MLDILQFVCVTLGTLVYSGIWCYVSVCWVMLIMVQFAVP